MYALPPCPTRVRRTMAAACITICLLLSGWPAIAQTDSDAFRARMEKWVETRTLLSKERSDWVVEKQFLQSTRDLLRDERDALREEIARLEASKTGAEEERATLAERRGDYQRTGEVLGMKITALEAKVKDLLPRLPAPLTKRLEPLFVQIPDDPAKTKLAAGQRLMNVLGVLSQTEKWNSTANFVGETRAVGSGGERIQVRTLYWGLGQAIYVDGQGAVAGVGRPGEAGWQFVDDEALAEDAKLLLDIYEGNVDTIAFVPMPVEIQE